MGGELQLVLRRQRLTRDKDGFGYWQKTLAEEKLLAEKAAILICDMWDQHWSRGAVARIERMVSNMNEVVKAARRKGVTIIHAPSGTLDFYENSPARRRIADVPRIEPPEPADHPDPPLPIDASDGGSDTNDGCEAVNSHVWTRQHPGIEIDEQCDFISDKGCEIYSLLGQCGIECLIIMGVHTNMCMLNRSFGIRQMVKWGVRVVLVRDLTDAMYNPVLPPYVSHEEGTRLVIKYIEKFWCPTVSSDDWRGNG